MNEERIKELEAQIKVLKEQKPRTDKEILESIEGLLEKVVRRLPKTQASSIRDLLDEIPVSAKLPPLVNVSYKHEYYCPVVTDWNWKRKTLIDLYDYDL